VSETIDPLAGSYYLEHLTNEMEKGFERYRDEIDGMGGMVAAVERGYPQRETIEAQLRTMARDDTLRNGAPASIPTDAASTLPPAARSALLKKLYQQTKLPDKPRNLVGMAKDIPDADLAALLAKNVSVNHEAMRQEAAARAFEHVVDGERQLLARREPFATATVVLAASATRTLATLSSRTPAAEVADVCEPDTLIQVGH